MKKTLQIALCVFALEANMTGANAQTDNGVGYYTAEKIEAAQAEIRKENRTANEIAAKADKARYDAEQARQSLGVGGVIFLLIGMPIFFGVIWWIAGKLDMRMFGAFITKGRHHHHDGDF